MSSTRPCRDRQSSKSGYEPRGRSLPGRVPHSITSRCGSRYGRGASSTLLMTLKIAVLAPMPSARVITATAVNTGCRRSERRAKRTSCFSTMRFSLRCSRPARRSSAERQSRRDCSTSPKRRHAFSRAGAGALPLVGEPPLAVHQPALLEAVQGDVQGAVGHLERAGRRVADDAGDAVPVPRTPRERLEDEDIERALEEVNRGGHGMSWSVRDMIRVYSLECQGNNPAQSRRRQHML